MKRDDGRSFDQLRRVNIQRNFIKYAEGSCLIELGNTRVICTASVDKNVPFFLRNSGQGWVKAEYRMLPRATHTRTQRDKVSGRNMEIQRLIGRSLRSVVNLKKIGERTIWIDCDVIQANGGTRTASITGGFIALVDCLNTLVRRNEIGELGVTDLLGAISVGISAGEHILDLTYLEDSQAQVDMNVVMKSSGEFIELQGTAEKGSFSEKDLSVFLKLAKKGIEEIIAIEKDLFKDILPSF
ncbi:MAG: ribonuclease PH [Candidatus Omnitrophica bacterium]|nr:ribonuclease PH [Candidatus Omnitrophota bacterium]MDD5429954.1 ribonuclease PH [Candidatus Omnitrophota bacterium]